MSTAYLLDRVGEPSQTFITGEIAELVHQGERVVVVAVDAAAGPGPDVPTTVLRDLSRPRLLLAAHHALWWLRSPRRYRRFREVVTVLGSEMGPGRNLVPWKRLPYAASRLRRQRVDGLHAHFAWQGAAAAMALSALTGLPWSMTVHANDIFARRRNLDAKLADADRLVTVCEYNARYLRDELGVTRPVEVVVCGVDLPQTLPGTEPAYDVVAVGRLVAKKGFDTLVAAAGLLRVRRPDLRVRIVGDGPLRADLERQIADAGLAGTVELAGALDHAASLASIAAGRVFCLPARIAPDGDRDSMPVVVKEAMARGVPIVASDVVAIPEMVDDAVGRLVPPDDPAALAAALDEMLSLGTDDRAVLATAARRRVRERFTMSAEVARLRALLAQTFQAPDRHDRASGALYPATGHHLGEEGA